MGRGAWIAGLVGGLALGRASSRIRFPFDNILDLFTEETVVARFITVTESAGGLKVPDPAAGFPLSDRHLQNIHAPGLIIGSFPVIFFRTRHTGRPTFSVRLNVTHLSQHTFANDALHSWHEIIPAGVLKPENNELTLAVNGDGDVTFGDIVILYQSAKLTIRRPPVLSPT